MNNVRNQLTDEFGGVPDTARYYKVIRGVGVGGESDPLTAVLCVCVCSPRMCHGWWWGMPTMAREAAENTLHWSQDTWGEGPSSSRALHAYTVRLCDLILYNIMRYV